MYTVLVPGFIVSVTVLALAIPALIVVETLDAIATCRRSAPAPAR
ncbi:MULTISPECIES: hypothetical protein [Nocardiaceae]|jgi:hypothetical protein|nr:MULTISPECIES: hypothetical protein [Rhodococcus]